MVKIVLQRATIKDIPELLAVENKLTGSKIYSAMTTKEEWKEELKKNNSVVYLILKNGKVIGDTSYEKKSDGTVYISGLAITPEFQGQGIGREVIGTLLKELAGVKKISLVTHPDNKVAIKLYISLGFEIAKRIENYYGDGEPRIELIKK